MATDEFRELLERRMNAGDTAGRAEIDGAIRARYERHRAVLISDMTGFSRITQEEGIVHFLELIHRMHRLAVPIIEAHGGQVVKSEADNLFAIFDSAQAAVTTAVALQDACGRAFAGKRANDTVALGIGIAAGRVLDLDGKDVFGDAVNLASKLGEDLAHGGDLFITQAAANDITTPSGWTAAPRREVVSNVEIEFVALRRDP
ncbi:MAG: adenylate/guanylate cyclase domain-containing protein [Myxococcota bacterium]